MNTTLKYLLLLLGAAYPCVAFVGLIGLHTTAAFFTSEVTFMLYASIGLLLIGGNDHGRPPSGAGITPAPPLSACSSRPVFIILSPASSCDDRP